MFWRAPQKCATSTVGQSCVDVACSCFHTARVGGGGVFVGFTSKNRNWKEIRREVLCPYSLLALRSCKTEQRPLVVFGGVACPPDMCHFHFGQFCVGKYLHTRGRGHRKKDAVYEERVLRSLTLLTTERSTDYMWRPLYLCYLNA